MTVALFLPLIFGVQGPEDKENQREVQAKYLTMIFQTALHSKGLFFTESAGVKLEKHKQ